ncbi:unnamed protein product [Nyctereutes procyonoides]|uniref:(raccoon dog) hypothetical protein n=1 Tax=Nyctereutes procyonoides TaxID=34880 RepID=A0A811XWC1_NYCPR|nr:unnamed protein product [Nyctereutes procyonoides]
MNYYCNYPSGTGRNWGCVYTESGKVGIFTI